MNIWNKLIGMLPKPKRLIATVTSSPGTGRYQVTTSEGGQALVTGPTTGITTGDKVFIQDGVIQAKAASLPSETIIIY